jgi:predicted nucleic acid-binding protein
MLRSTHHVKLIPVDITVAARAADLRAKYSLRTPDALPVVSGLATGCDAFLTNDLDLKRVQETRILVLDELELDE